MFRAKEESTEDTYAVIMAGEGGARLEEATSWTIAAFVGKETLLQGTLARLGKFFLPERNLVEPAPRGTASVVGLAAAVLQKRGP